ncbi:helix-turn-helix domain-containing protein [Alteromonas sp. C1M14]|uniref:helix-turn-helix domain-containing protein n=1 Tax=Alteromonas sp. C1M14 TaxID=2841567 RepID=UPI001C0A19D0|nr:helix-turn-helix domain-containing protein [Alteromonas sp. C1M14]MBU2977629.1 helix-turn-helix domain-containing protein [Alteromonas sp. C1M14]
MNKQDRVGQQIAAVLKRERQAKGWSLDKTAKQTGVSKAMLGQIERLESSPTIATLWKIATGLQCSFSSFISQDEATDVALQDDPRVQGFTEDPNMTVTTLFCYSPKTKFETFEITLSNYHEQRSSPHHCGVLEHIHVLEGRLRIFEGAQERVLTANEQCVLHGDVPHGYRDEAGKSRFIDIIFYP